jgi:hypothetical protein
MADSCHKYRFKRIIPAEREARRFGSRNEDGTGLPNGAGLSFYYYREGWSMGT